ncbi:MAG: Ty1/Copia family ribonuclease HI [Planctomycetaceae bacterium]|nr:Ty1/Copia family ribonuclease HI [Planctomycetaceae bacterium]
MFDYVIYYGGAPVSYVAKHLKVIALSSAEAEYAAASYACKEITFVRKVLVDLGYVCNGPTVLAVDNEAAIKIATNLGVTARNKHFADALHYFRHLVDHLVVKPTFVRTTMQRADGFTKPLGKTLFRPWVASLGLK